MKSQEIYGKAWSTMFKDVKGTFPPKTIILHNEMKNLKSKSTSEQIVDNIISLAKPAKSDENSVFMSSLTNRTDKLNNKAPKVNDILQRKFGTISLIILNSITYSNMLNSSEFHLNDSGTTCLVNNFCYALSKWYKSICIGNNILPKEKHKLVKIFLIFNFSKENADRKIQN